MHVYIYIYIFKCTCIPLSENKVLQYPLAEKNNMFIQPFGCLPPFSDTPRFCPAGSAVFRKGIKAKHVDGYPESCIAIWKFPKICIVQIFLESIQVRPFSYRTMVITGFSPCSALPKSADATCENC